MKAHRTPEFTPVTLTLETQAEVDGIFALLNHDLSNSVGIHYDDYQCLKPFASHHANKLHSALCAYISKSRSCA